jgi:WD40 repeat protein
MSLPVFATAAAVAAWLIGSAIAIASMTFPTIGGWAVLLLGWVVVLPITLGANRVASALDHVGGVDGPARFQAVAIPLVLAFVVPLAAGRWLPGVARSELAVPPGSPHLVFATTLTGDSEVELYDPAAPGDHLVRLTHDPATDREPALSPDGRRVVFVSDRDGDDDLYVLELEGHRLSRLTDMEGSERTPAWSPDGTTIAFSSDHDGDYDVWTVAADGTGRTDVSDANPDGDAEPSWSPDGRRIAASDLNARVWDIRIWPVDGGHGANVTATFDGFAWEPHWSAAGDRIAFSGSSGDRGAPDAYTMDADGTGVSRLTDEPSSDWAKGWFDDDRYVWIISDRPGAGVVWAYYLPAGGGEPTLFVRA